MTRFTALVFAAALSVAPFVSHAAETRSCTPAEQAGAQYSNSGLSCGQWVQSFAPNAGATQTAHNDRAPAPRS